MGELRLLVAGDDPDLARRLQRVFAYEHPLLIPDRRFADRRRRSEPWAIDRRAAERRSWKRTDEDLRRRGFALLNGDGGDPQGDQAPWAIPQTAMRAARIYLQDRFPHQTTLSWWNRSRGGQACLVLGAVGYPAHRVLFLEDFLFVYGTSLLDHMHRVLDEWKLMDQVLGAGPEPVTVSAYGIRRGEC